MNLKRWRKLLYLLLIPAALAAQINVNSTYLSSPLTATSQTSAPINLSNRSWSAGTIQLTGVSLTTATFGVLGSSDPACGSTTFQPIAINLFSTPGTVATTMTATATALYQVNLAGLYCIEYQTSGTFTATSITLLLTASPNAIVGRSGGSSGSAVTAVSNSDGTLAISPTTGVVVASLALGHANTWTATQTFATISPTTITSAALSGTFTGAPIFSGNVSFTGTPTFSNPLALGSSTSTTQTLCDNSTKLATTAYAGIVCNLVETTGSPLSVIATSTLFWNNSSGAYVFDLPTPTSGLQFCFGNYKTVAHAISAVPPSGVTIYYKGIAGTAGSSTGIVSSGLAGDFFCVVGTDSTTYEVTGAGQGTLTNN
jgi:hypothetical protein